MPVHFFLIALENTQRPQDDFFKGYLYHFIDIEKQLLKNDRLWSWIKLYMREIKEVEFKKNNVTVTAMSYSKFVYSLMKISLSLNLLPGIGVACLDHKP